LAFISVPSFLGYFFGLCGVEGEVVGGCGRIGERGTDIIVDRRMVEATIVA
jgi:hypothetical protein